MKTRILAMLLALALLLVGSVLVGWAAEQLSALAMPAVSGVAAGGGYRVAVESAPAPRVMVRQVSGAAVGGHYRIELATGTWATSLTASGIFGSRLLLYLPAVHQAIT